MTVDLLLAFWTHEVTTSSGTKNPISERNIRCNYDAELRGNPAQLRIAKLYRSGAPNR
jgi:hypothetical protein